MLQLEYTVVGNFDPDECRGQVELQLPSGASAPTLLQVKHAFPFEGDFHFRFQWYPTGAEDFVWLDVVDDAQVVPMTNAGTVAVQALSLEDVAQDHDDDHVQAEVPQPSRRLLASWEEVSGADLAAEAAAAATSAAAAAEESRGARAAGRPPVDATSPDSNASASSSEDVGVSSRSAVPAEQTAGGVSSVLHETLGLGWKTVSSATNALLPHAGRASKSISRFFSSTARAASSYLSGGAQPSAQALVNLHRWQLQLQAKFSHDNIEHETLLQRLWAALYPDRPFKPKSSKWKRAGFQGPDPATDFRGGGELALRCMLYFAEAYGDDLKRIIDGQAPRTESNYPVAAAGINVVMVLSSILHLHGAGFTQQRRVFWPLFEDPVALYELFTVSFCMLDAMWVESGAKYMQFGEVCRALQERVEAVLLEAPATPEQLREVAARYSRLR